MTYNFWFKKNIFVIFVFILLFLSLSVQGKYRYSQSEDDVGCALRSVSSLHNVCVCNASYCDTLPIVKPVPKGFYIIYTSTLYGQRFNKTIARSSNSSSANVFKINRTVKRQTIIGFGGAFTDAAGINIANLSDDLQKTLVASYFSNYGIEYTVGRVPLASCDFSTHTYSYDDVVGDLNLTKFALAPEDLKYKIPYLQMAVSMAPDPVRLFGSAWSSPAWMKTNDKFIGKGTLIGSPGGKYYKTWANYYVKFLQAYQQYNITFWGLTSGNEPNNGFQQGFKFQDLGFTAELQRDFVKMDLGPSLQAAGFGNVSVMMFDDQRSSIVPWTKTVLSDPDASKYLAGVAVHWYADFGAPASLLTLTHNNFPEKFILATEACEGAWHGQKHVDLGAWDRAAIYTGDIMDDLNNWVAGWTDWNIALDMTGGPNWVSNFADAPIIVNAEKKEFYKQPMFYAMGHFSKFVRPGSVWVEVNAPKGVSNIQITAFERPDKAVVVVIHNNGASTINLTLSDGESGNILVNSPGFSIQTVLWW